MPLVTVRDHPFFYSESPAVRGRRPAAVLIHGAGESHQTWPLELRLSPHHSILTVDMPGHGQSGGLAPSLDDQVQVLLAWLAQLDLARVVLGGHSLGGAVALHFALTHPERVAGLILVSTGARLRVAPPLLAAVKADPHNAIDLILSHSFGSAAPPDAIQRARDLMLATAPAAFAADWSMCDGFDVREALPRLTMPTLVLCGQHDTMTPPKYSSFLSENIQGAVLQWSATAGHMLPLEDPELVTSAVTRYIGQI